MIFPAAEKCSGAGLSRADWIHMAQQQYSQMEAFLMATAPNHFLGVRAQRICGTVKFFLLKLWPKKGIGSKVVRSLQQRRYSSATLTAGKLHSASSPKEKELPSVKVHILWHKSRYSWVVWPGCHFG